MKDIVEMVFFIQNEMFFFDPVHDLNLNWRFVGPGEYLMFELLLFNNMFLLKCNLLFET